MVEESRDTVDVLLVFVSDWTARWLTRTNINCKAGLFSAVVTTFIRADIPESSSILQSNVCSSSF